MLSTPFEKKMSKAEAGARGGRKSGESRRRRKSGISNGLLLNSDTESASNIPSKRAKTHNSQYQSSNPADITKHSLVPTHTEKRFQPKESHPHVPKSIPVIKEVPNTVIDLPISLNLGGGEALLLSSDINPYLKSRDFWVDLCKRLEKLIETCSDETYGTIVEAKTEL